MLMTPLSTLLPLDRPQEHKVHFAKRDKSGHPLDDFIRSRAAWQGWQEHRGKRNVFTRRFIFSLMDFYPEPDTWLYGGIWEVKARHPTHYHVELTDTWSDLIGRLKIGYSYKGRTTRADLENYWRGFTLRGILDEPYTGRSFPGIQNVILSFSELETLVRISRPDWKGALSSTKGVYLITDKSTQKSYVGSAYGSQGIWSRWCEYAAAGHGDTVELKSLVGQGLTYPRNHFQFALLEPCSFQTPDAEIIARETHWKNALRTKAPHGLNRN